MTTRLEEATMMAANEQSVVPGYDAQILPQAEPPVIGESQEETEAAVKKRGGGVKTPEGAEISRRNSLEYGLWAKKVFPKSLQADIDQCTAEATTQFRPRSMYELRLVREIGRATAQCELAGLHVLLEQQRLMDRARTSWESDRRKVVEDKLARRLSQEPERISDLLKDSRQGTEWTLRAWTRLGDALAVSGGWDEFQRSLAYDLLGEPLIFRNSSLALPPADDVAGLKAVVAREQAALRQSLEEYLIEYDEADQAMAASGMPRLENAELKRLRRAESAARRTRDKARTELLRVQGGAPTLGGAPAPGGAPPAPPASPAPAPPPPPAPAASASAPPAPPKSSDEKFVLRLQRKSVPSGPPKPATPRSAPVTQSPVPPAATAPAVAPPPAAAPQAITPAPVVRPPVAPVTVPVKVGNAAKRLARQQRLEQRKREKQARKANRGQSK
jgi:hypothetical protein